jgi:hypothetical protein
MRFWLLILAMLGCAESEYTVSPQDPSAAAPGEVPAAAPLPEQAVEEAAPVRWLPLTERSASFQGQVTEDQSTVQESFWIGEGATTAMADYLFVVDDSVSMANILDSFHRGFEGLSDSDAFPANAKIAVMNMTPADPDNLRRRHPVVPFRSQAALSPGFLRLVDSAGIHRFNQAALLSERLEPLEHEGCSAWFSPDATNAQGEPCLLAHTQLVLGRSVAEAGLVSFAQLLQKSRGRPLFREGAAVSVIFVSDTHGPGFRPGQPDSFMEEQFDELVGLQPGYSQLRTMVEATQLVASFRVHAIAPERECSEPWMDWIDPVYFEAARAGEGVSADSCTTTDYSQVIRSIAERGAEIQSSVYPLTVTHGVQPVEVESVLRGGRPIGWTMSPSGRALVVDEEMASSKEEITVRYRVGRPARPKTSGAQSLESARQAR